MDRLIQFGTSDDVYYAFDDVLSQVRPYFGEAVPLTTTIPGVNGGFNVGGRSASRLGLANLQAFMWFEAVDSNTMQSLIRDVYKMLHWGEQRLFKRDMAGDVMWTWAMVNNIDLNQNVANRPRKQQQVQLNYQCPRAVWFRKPDDVLSSAGAYTEGATRDGSNTVGDGDSIVVTNNGNAPAGLYLKWTVPSGQSLTNPRVARRDGAGTDIEYIQYTGTLSASSTWEADARNHQLQLGGVVSSDYDKLTVITGEWLTLPPGDTTLHISGTFTGGDCTLDLDWWDTYS